ncbi:MAG: hypothetical protein NTX73_04440 [Rhodobacterales bacterium]|nr:hypothetical protein [Rhodobacterales bacterium]
MTEASANPVRRRRVFYIPGYDPFHPRRYRELYRKEAAAQAAVSGYEIDLSPKRGGGPYGWHVAGRMDGTVTEADVEVLVWSDLVETSMTKSVWASYAQLFYTGWIYITSGALRRLMWLRKGPVIAALYPVGMLLAQLAVAVIAGAVLAGLVVRGINSVLGLAGWSIGVVTPYLRWGIILVVTRTVLVWFKGKDKWFLAYYLMHDFAYWAWQKGANPPEIEVRLAAFGDTIAAALNQDYDEVLIVGHSVGAHLGINVLSDLLRAGRVTSGGPALSLLTVGEVIPMVSFLPDAKRLRADLAFLSMRDDLTWVDVTAPGDGCSFALCDPVAVSGVAPEGKKWPLVFSAAFTHSLSKERWKELRWQFFRLHFQYLCAFDQPKDYDYFRITAGPLTLAQRYAGRPPSKSRIDVPASKYTSMAA